MIEFILNNKHIKTDESPTTTLLDFIRYNKRLTGTKIGCREGDCGACTVLVGRLAKDKADVDYESITACISPLGNAHGKHIVTIEGLNLPNKLSLSQKAMHDNYATQCGFCTPGFVTSLTGYGLAKAKGKTMDVLDAVSGNICRCTGYKSIEKAAHQVCQSTKEHVSIDDLTETGFIPEYFKGILEKLNTIKSRSLKSFSGQIVSGGTDLYVQRADSLQNKQVNLLLDDEVLKEINLLGGVFQIGASTTVSDILQNKDFQRNFPQLKKHLKLVSSEQIRNMASIGGNIVNASPIGDMTIFFLALNSWVILANHKENVNGNHSNERRLPLKSLFKGYKDLNKLSSEIIKSLQCFVPPQHFKFNFEKVCKRTHLDIASVNTAISIYMPKNKLEEVHLAMGGVAPIPKYLEETSFFLKGKEPTVVLLLEANHILQNEIAPISDVRGSSDYKRLLARQLFFAHFIELFPEKFQLKDFVNL